MDGEHMDSALGSKQTETARADGYKQSQCSLTQQLTNKYTEMFN